MERISRRRTSEPISRSPSTGCYLEYLHELTYRQGEPHLSDQHKNSTLSFTVTEPTKLPMVFIQLLPVREGITQVLILSTQPLACGQTLSFIRAKYM